MSRSKTRGRARGRARGRSKIPFLGLMQMFYKRVYQLNFLTPET
ncbi:hypothetical protein D1AOALGA4SA_3217 [Olavius algarvensis Delta 1 endosymbiont]|nr:hypothetical protein D1AOALGA4SA_3217 [Olavius algarvensis Delta 1 endosymbiont]